jgi:hypothetical protein
MMNLVPTESSRCYKVYSDETWGDKPIFAGYIEQCEDGWFYFIPRGASLSAGDLKWLGNQLVSLNSKQ